jgi:hypothetical protein
MAYAIKAGAYADMYILTYTGNLETEDLLVSNELHLNEGRPIYLLVDILNMNDGLPDRFLETIMQSYVTHPNLGCLAACMTSKLLRMTAGMVIKVTRRADKITVHDTFEAAEKALIEAMKQDGRI